jgi:hypothetical protein
MRYFAMQIRSKSSADVHTVHDDAPLEARRHDHGIILRIHSAGFPPTTGVRRANRPAINSLPFRGIGPSSLSCGISLTWRHAAEPRCIVYTCPVRRDGRPIQWTVHANAASRQWGFANYGWMGASPSTPPDNAVMRPKS